MYTLVKADGQVENNACEYRGKSTDNKDVLLSTGIPKGSTFYEMDTTKLFMYDAEEKQWIEQ